MVRVSPHTERKKNILKEKKYNKNTLTPNTGISFIILGIIWISKRLAREKDK